MEKKNVNTEVLSKPVFDYKLNSCLTKRKTKEKGILWKKRKKKLKKKKIF
jgi:hypothetical protein